MIRWQIRINKVGGRYYTVRIRRISESVIRLRNKSSIISWSKVYGRHNHSNHESANWNYNYELRKVIENEKVKWHRMTNKPCTCTFLTKTSFCPILITINHMHEKRNEGKCLFIIHIRQSKLNGKIYNSGHGIEVIEGWNGLMSLSAKRVLSLKEVNKFNRSQREEGGKKEFYVSDWLNNEEIFW